MDLYIRLITLIGEVSKERPELNFNWWLPLAENRLREEENASSGSTI
jgi:hypothetical protein